MITRIIDNFTGALTRKGTGQLNSGLAKYEFSFGYDPFTRPGDLTWLEQPTSLVGIQGNLVEAAKPRLESDTTYVYMVDDAAIVKKVMVNNTSTKNPNADSVIASFGVLSSVATGSIASFTKGGSMAFFGATERIYIGHDNGINRITFDGTVEGPVTNASSITTGIPRPMANFLGKLYFANGTNIGEIDSTGTVTSYAKLSPGFPSGTFIRDLDVTPDGNYLQILVSRINGPKLSSANPTSDTTVAASADSYKFYWNGSDTGYTAFETYSGYSLVSNTVYGQSNMTTGYDLGGGAIYSGSQKVKTLPGATAPTFNAQFSTGNLLGMGFPEYVPSIAALRGAVMFYGQYDDEMPSGLFRFLRLNPTVSGTDIQVMPICIPVTNIEYGSTQDGYSNNVVGTGKLYLSAYDREGAATGSSRLYKFTTVPTGLNSVLGGVWESQNEIFSKKSRPVEVRLYTEPLTTSDNSFKMEFVDSTSSVLIGKTFTAGTAPVALNDDKVWWNPTIFPGYSWGLRITNLGSKNWVGIKAEIDFVEAGK